MKLFPYETRHLELFKDIRIKQDMEELCPIKVESFSSLGFLDPYLFLDHNIRFLGPFSVKLVLLESRLKYFSNNI